MGETLTIPRVVLVDDNADMLEPVTLLLRDKYQVFGYTCATEALKAVEAVKPDVLVLDIQMGPIDGLQCLETIRAMPGYPRIPAIALTGFARDVERRAFLASGFQAVVVKPMLDPDELVTTIDTVLGVASVGGERSRPPVTEPITSAAAHLDGSQTITAYLPGESATKD